MHTHPGLQTQTLKQRAEPLLVLWRLKRTGLGCLIETFEDEEDAIALANGTDYGLLAAVWTENAGRLQRVAKAVQAGQVFMNCYGAGGGVELPFGGTKRSGHGREKGLLALEELSSCKTLVHYHG